MLENILDNPENLEHPKYREEDKPEGGWDEEAIEMPATEGFCIECEGGLPLLRAIFEMGSVSLCARCRSTGSGVL